MSGPYREAVATKKLEAPTREGLVRLEIGARHAALDVAGRIQVSVADQQICISDRGRRGRIRALRLAGERLFLARGVPSSDIGFWVQRDPGSVSRLFGMRPLILLDGDALRAWRLLDRLADCLCDELQTHGGCSTRALEFGHGADRVLVLEQGERLVLYVRRLFREHPRRVLEVDRDGTVVLVEKHGERTARCTSRYGVTVLGDHIRFADEFGLDVASLWLPWIAREDRDALARRLGEQVDQDQLLAASR